MTSGDALEALRIPFVRSFAAGRAAGLQTVAALYGYIPAEENAAAWGADCRINTPLELLDVLGLDPVGTQPA